MDCEDDRFSTSSSSFYDGLSPKNSQQKTTHKSKDGRRKFKETRHPVYRGIRKKNGSKWVCEVREPNKKSRIWLGTFPTQEMAARAHDVAVLALRGDSAALNFADSAHSLPRAQSSSARDIQAAAFRAAEAFRPSEDTVNPSSSSSSSSSSSASSMDCSLQQNCKEQNNEESWVHNNKVQENQNMRSESIIDKSERVLSHSSSSMFMDEEAVFNMPLLMNSMAEGLLLTPPAMKKGFHWNDMEDDLEFISLWKD